MSKKPGHVCPVETAGMLDGKLRRWVHNPVNILSPFISEGMTVLDVGCGPCFFSIEMARLVGTHGSVIAAVLQPGMLLKVENKIKGTEMENRILLHQCREKEIGISNPVDFVLLFYMVHEIPDKNTFFTEIKNCLKPGGQVLVAEPWFHVSKKAFDRTVKTANDAGLADSPGPRIRFSRSMILTQESR